MSNLGNKQIMAKNIRYYMNKHSVSQTELCNTLGFKMPTFSDWVNAKTYPRIDKIELMANYFGISKADLVEDHDEYTGKTFNLKIKYSKSPRSRCSRHPTGSHHRYCGRRRDSRGTSTDR